MTLQNKFQGCFRAQGHERINLIFAGINALVLEHFTISLLLEFQQQMRNEQVETFDEVAKVAEKKEENMEEVPRPTMQSIANVIQFFIKLEP